jgi:hypothetical protein
LSSGPDLTIGAKKWSGCADLAARETTKKPIIEILQPRNAIAIFQVRYIMGWPFSEAGS